MSSRRDRLLPLLALLISCDDAAAPPRSTDDPHGSAARPAAQVAAVAPATSPPVPAAPTRVTPSPAIPPPSPRAITLDEPPISLPRQESFQLLDAGKGRKATLRYAFAAGTLASIAEVALSSRQLTRDGFSRPTALPVIRDGFAITVATDQPDRLALRALRGEPATRTPDTDAYLATWRTLLENRPITAAVDPRGQLSTITFLDDRAGTRSARARDELAQRLLGTIVPLPVEPVGTGASWRVVTILRHGPAYAKQTATYTLISRTPDRWKLRIKLQRVGEEQRVADPSLPPGTTSDLVALFRLLKGDVEVDPTYPLIAAGSLTMEARVHVRLQAPNQPPTEQIFDDTGKVAFSLCRPASAAGAHADEKPRRAPCPDSL
jgi:hypothetical protein